MGTSSSRKNCSEVVFKRSSLFLKMSKERKATWFTNDVFSHHPSLGLGREWERSVPEKDAWGEAL